MIEIKEKIFKISEKKSLKLEKKEFFNKKIINAKINQNCILLTEKNGPSNNHKKKEKFDDFIELLLNYDIFFDNSFDTSEIPINLFYLLIRKSKFFLNDNNKYIYVEEHLKDIFKEKLNGEIDELLQPLNFKQYNLENYMKCQYCQKNIEELYYYIIFDYKLLYFHKQCYETNKNIYIIRHKKFSQDKVKIIAYLKYNLYESVKKIILNEKSIVNKIIEKLFDECEKSFDKIASIYNQKEIPLIEQNIIDKKILAFKNMAFKELYNNKEEKEKLIEEEFKKFEDNKNTNKEKEKKNG